MSASGLYLCTKKCGPPLWSICRRQMSYSIYYGPKKIAKLKNLPKTSWAHLEVSFCVCAKAMPLFEKWVVREHFTFLRIEGSTQRILGKLFFNAVLSLSGSQDVAKQTITWLQHMGQKAGGGGCEVILFKSFKMIVCFFGGGRIFTFPYIHLIHHQGHRYAQNFHWDSTWCHRKSSRWWCMECDNTSVVRSPIDFWEQAATLTC